MGSPIAEASSSPLCSFLTHMALGCIKVLSLFTHVKWQITICYSTPKSVLGDTLEFTVKMLLLQSILWQITFFLKWICHDHRRKESPLHPHICLWRHVYYFLNLLQCNSIFQNVTLKSLPTCLSDPRQKTRNESIIWNSHLPPFTALESKWGGCFTDYAWKIHA